MVRGTASATYDVVPAQISATPFVLAKAIDPHLPVLQKDYPERAEAFRALRLRIAEQKDPRAILVTSAKDGEGKTTCAANLALALAELAHLRVLLVEANLLRPKLSAIFGFHPSHDLISQLTEHRQQLNAPWRTTEIQPFGLHVLAVAQNATADVALHIPTLSSSTARWRRTFDYVVFDGPSALSSCEASVIQEFVDAVVVVARSGATNRTLRRALEQLSADKVAGVVLMDSPAKSGSR